MNLKIKQFCLALLLLVFSTEANAQCAMCRAALANSDGNVKAEAVNDGIVYLMVFPYLLIGVVGYAVYRLRKNMIDKKTG
jgi:uncharacterized membrane protein